MRLDYLFSYLIFHSFLLQSYKLMYSQVTPILVKAIQELSAKVEDLEKQLNNKE